MIPFDYQSPTKIYFGIGKEKEVGKIIKEYGFKKVLFHYGKQSIKNSGLYDLIIKSLQDSNIEFIELGGVEANPDITLVREGVKLCKKENIDFILAVGGGSVIDSAKSIGHGYYYNGDPYDFNQQLITASKSIPIGVILTIAAAGSEMSNSCVISDASKKLKKGFNAESNRPLFVIENPALTYSVSRVQTAYGIVDIISHSLERYFNESADIELADYFAEGLIKAVIDAGKIVILEPTNYDARATLMVASSYSHNGLTGIGKKFSFPIHQLEHELSGLRHDIAHGAGLACLIPAWMKLMLDYDLSKLAQFAINVMKVDDQSDKRIVALDGINKLENFFLSLGISTHLKDYQINKEDIDLMCERIPLPVKGKISLTRDLVKRIYLLAL